MLGVVGLILMNIGWNQAPPEGWGEPYIPIVFVLGIIAIVGFVYVERHTDVTSVLAGVSTGFLLSYMRTSRILLIAVISLRLAPCL